MPRAAIHPGEVLSDELEARDLSAAELARQIHVPVNRITQIMNGKRNVTADTALRLGKFFGTGPELWINLQKQYELRRASQRIANEIEQIPTHG